MTASTPANPVATATPSGICDQLVSDDTASHQPQRINQVALQLDQPQSHRLLPSRSLTLGHVRPQSVEAWIAERRSQGLSDSTIRQAYTVLRLMLDTAKRDGLIRANPTHAVKRPKSTAQEADFLDAQQVRDLLVAEDSRYHDLFELIARTGMRRGKP